MALFLFLAFLVVPLVELFVIGQVTAQLGLGLTIVLLVADSIAGAYLVRREGSRAWQSFREAIAAGRMPGDELIGGVLLLGGGALLLTPGFVTDVVGLLLVLPFSRAPIAALLRRRYAPVIVQDGLGGIGATFTRRGGASGGAAGDASNAGAVEVLSIEREPRPTHAADEPGDVSDDPTPES